MNVDNKAAGLLGFAQKSGNVVSGEQAVEGAVRRGRVQLLLIATDASANTRKKFSNLASTHGLPVLSLTDMESMGQWIGKARRSVIGVTDTRFAASINRAAVAAERGKST